MSDAKDQPESKPKSDASELLDSAEQALKRGHFAAARIKLAESEKSDEKSDALKARRAKLWTKLSPDPMIPLLIAACLALYVTLIAVYVH